MDVDQDVLDAWVAHMRAAGLARGTVTLRVSHARRALAEIGRPISQITTGDLERWLALHEWGPEARRSARTSLRQLWRWCVREGIVLRDVASDLPEVRRPRTVPRAVPDPVVMDALRAADPRVSLAVEIMATCGLRRAECARVRSCDVAPVGQGWILRVIGKGGHERLVPCPGGLARRIRAASGYVFPGSDSGHLSPAWLGRLIGRVLPPGVTPHQLRHRYATVAYSATHDLRAVQSLLGHASVATTQIYVTVDDSAAVDAAQATWKIAV